MLELSSQRWTRILVAGDRLSFGRGDGVDLELGDDPRLHRRCGTVSVTEAGWELANDGAWLRLRVRGLDRPGSDSVLPGASIVVPWRFARIEIHTGSLRHEMVARWSAPHPPAERRTVADDAGERTHVPVRIDREAAYFRALVALCEPQLRDPASSDVATDLQIARRLNRSGAELRRVGGKAVERRLDTCRGHFGLKAGGPDGHGAGLEQRDGRRRLVELAILTGTVTSADLAVLDPVPPER